jgi:serine protease AprX
MRIHSLIRRAFTAVIVVLFFVSIPLLLGAQWKSVPMMPQSSPRPLVLAKQRPVVSSRLADFVSRLDPKDSVVVWVFFTDKGIFSQEKYQEAKTDFEDNSTGSALRRRLKNGVSADFLDLPVNQSYVHRLVSLGARLRHRSRWLNAVSAEIQAEKIEDVAELPFVREIRKVAAFGRIPPEPMPFLGRPSESLSPEFYGRNYGESLDQLEQINVPVVHDMGFMGQGVIVGMLDTGYRTDHQAFDSAFADSRVLAEWDFIHDNGDVGNQSGDSSYQYDHGTFTWSTLGGEHDGRLYGPAFKASFVLAKTEDVAYELPIEEDHWVAGLEWADSIGAEVISSSLGYSTWDDSGGAGYTYEDMNGHTALCTQAADLAASRGILVVNAAGNERQTLWHFIIAPADAESIIAVGAVDQDDKITTFSSAGPTYDGRIKPEVVARGLGTYCAGTDAINWYERVSGTSLSTPLVGGCAAALFSAHPDWTNMQVREALMMTADRASNPDTLYGWGLINLFEALNFSPSGALTILHNPPLFSPDTLNPYVIGATITSGRELVPDSLFVYWRADPLASFSSLPLEPTTGYQYEAQIPAQPAGTIVQYYISARDDLGYVVNQPLSAPDFKFRLFVATQTIEFDLENGLALWATGGVNDRWSLTSADSHSGKFCLTDSPRDGYDNNTDSWAQINKAFDLTGAVSPQLSFWHKYQFWSGDSGFVEISTDGGQMWEQLSVFADTQGTWTQVSLLLDPYAGYGSVRFRFRLISDDAGTGDGWYIDDVQVNFQPTYVEQEPASVPQEFSLGQNYPNPFNPTTTIPFTVHGSQFMVRSPVHTTLRVYNVRGQLVRTLVDQEMQPGKYSVMWDGKNQNGKDVSSGVYLYRLSAGDVRITKKMLLLK